MQSDDSYYGLAPAADEAEIISRVESDHEKPHLADVRMKKVGSGVVGAMFRLKTSHSKLQLLPRCLTFWHLVPLGVGSTVGAGVYVLVGTAARERTGPALPLSFVIAGTAAGLAALCYAELASRCPSAGSAYHYAYTTVGEVVAWLIGWALILEYTVGGSAVARGISPNLSTLFGGPQNMPFFLARFTLPDSDVVLDPTAALLVILVTFLLSSGIKESARVQAIVTLANVLVLLFVIIAGAWAASLSGWEGYKQPGGYMPFGVDGLLGGAAMVFYSYIGFDTVASTAEEVKHPQKDLPLGIGLSLIACGGLYIGVAAVLVGLVPYSSIDVDTPISSAFSQHGMPWAMYITTAGALAALSSTLLGSLLPQPRILMAMARDGLLPRWFCRLSPATGVPVNSTIVTGAMAATMSFSMNIGQLSGMVSLGTLLAFTVVSVSVLILRYVPPQTELAVPPVARPPLVKRKQAAVAVPAVAATRMFPGSMSPAAELPFPYSIPKSAAVRFLPVMFKGLLTPSPPVSSFSDEPESIPSFMDVGSEDPLRSNHLGASGTGGGLDRWQIRSSTPGPDGSRPPTPPLPPLAPVNSIPNASKAEEQGGQGSIFFAADEDEIEDAIGSQNDPVDLDEAAQMLRRSRAALAISTISIGVPLLAIAVSFPDLPRWVLWSATLLGLPLFLGGTIGLFLSKEDEGRHQFGQAGGFVCPLVPLLPISSIMINVYLMVNLGGPTWLRSGIWLALGAMVYLSYGMKHSVLAKAPLPNPHAPKPRQDVWWK